MPSTGVAVTVLVVDDHPVLLHGLTALLQSQSWVGRVVTAGTIAEAQRVVITELADMAIVDLSLPDGDGLDLIHRIRHAAPSCSILVLTLTPEDEAVRACLRAGASGYVLKDTMSHLILSAAQTVAEGGTVLGPRVGREPLTSSSQRKLPEPLNRLLDKDLEVLCLVADGLSNRAIARRLDLSEKTVRNRLSGIFATLGVDGRVQAALLARDNGLRASTGLAEPPVALTAPIRR